MLSSYKILAATTLSLLCTCSLWAQQQPDNSLQQLSLEDLLNLKVEMSSLTQAQSLRETPNSVSIFTREDIQAMGARNLVDILNLIPGVTFAQDVQNNIGIGMRGIWSVEAKVLMLLDGQMMNDLSYLCTQFEHNYYIDQIERIEVIRGSGSTAYSNAGGIGVINIITHKESPDDKLRVSASLGADRSTTFRRTAGVSVSHSYSPTKYYSMHGFLGNGVLSNEVHSFDNPNDTLYKAGLSSLANTQKYTNMMFRSGNLFGNFIYQDNMQAAQTLGFQTWSRVYPTRYKHAIGDIHYNWKINDEWTIVPRFTARYGSSYEANTAPAPADTANTYGTGNWGNTPVNQYNATVEARYTPTTKLELLIGSIYQHATMRYDVNAGGGALTYEGKSSMTFTTVGAYTNALIKLTSVNIVGGLKVERHSQFGLMAAPRIALTRMSSKWHFKAQYAETYRAPSMRGWDLANQNSYFRQSEILNTAALAPYLGHFASNKLVPERIQTAELEVGRFIGKQVAVNGNLSYNNVKAPIVYVIDSASSQTYYNHPYYTTMGAEIEVRYRSKKGYVTGSITNYRYANKHNVEEYSSSTDPNKNGSRGLPERKIVLNGAYYLSSHLTLFASMIYLGEAWVIEGGTNPFHVEEDEYSGFMINSTLSYKDFLAKGLDISLSAYNILGSDYDMGQAYPAGDSPIVYSPRELILKVAYRFAEEN